MYVKTLSLNTFLNAPLLCWLIEADWRIYVSKLTTIGPYNGLSPGWYQAIVWTNAGINFSGILIDIRAFSSKKMHFQMSSGKW